jgi:hypothetical protein
MEREVLMRGRRALEDERRRLYYPGSGVPPGEAAGRLRKLQRALARALVWPYVHQNVVENWFGAWGNKLGAFFFLAAFADMCRVSQPLAGGSP